MPKKPLALDEVPDLAAAGRAAGRSPSRRAGGTAPRPGRRGTPAPRRSARCGAKSSSFCQSGMPQKSSPSHQTVPASSAMRSVSPRRGSTFANAGITKRETSMATHQRHAEDAARARSVRSPWPRTGAANRCRRCASRSARCRRRRPTRESRAAEREHAEDDEGEHECDEHGTILAPDPRLCAADAASRESSGRGRRPRRGSQSLRDPRIGPAPRFERLAFAVPNREMHTMWRATASLRFVLRRRSRRRGPLASATTLTWPGSPGCTGTLQTCIEASGAGDTIEIATDTPVDESLALGDRSLTLTSAPYHHASLATGRSIDGTASPSAGAVAVSISKLRLRDGRIGLWYDGTATATYDLRELDIAQSIGGATANIRVASSSGTVNATVYHNHIRATPASLNGGLIELATTRGDDERVRRVQHARACRSGANSDGAAILVDVTGFAGTARRRLFRRVRQRSARRLRPQRHLLLRGPLLLDAERVLRARVHELDRLRRRRRSRRRLRRVATAASTCRRSTTPPSAATPASARCCGMAARRARSRGWSGTTSSSIRAASSLRRRRPRP